MNNTTIGADLAKDVIQVCIFSQQIKKKAGHPITLNRNHLILL